MAALKRIMTDLLMLHKDPIPNTFLSYDESNLFDIKLLVIGPQNTPYAGGFYMFQLNFTNDYPRKPPTVLFLTTNNRIRFHPNLYENGKVCLSILGTWYGPKWTPAMSLGSIIHSLQSIMCSHPMKNEPGYENLDVNSQICENYNNVVEFFNWKFAINYVITCVLVPAFDETIKRYYNDNKKWYQDKLLELQHNKPLQASCMYGMQVYIDYSTLSIL